MKFDELRALIELHCADLLDKPGEVYFGSLDALSHPNGLAIIGLNPGGSELPSMRENLDRYSQEGRQRFSGYLDTCWHEPFFSRYETCSKCESSLVKSKKVHQQRHQRTVDHIATELDIDLRETLALNAIWLQTPNTDSLRQLLAQLQLPKMESLFQAKFFPVIDELLDRCKVRLVLCLGNGATESSFNFFREALGVSRTDVVHVSDDYRDGRYFVHDRNGQRRIYFGIAHPSLHSTRPAGLARLRDLWATTTKATGDAAL
nr:hypothetical protein [uncultured Roseateles sp.]